MNMKKKFQKIYIIVSNFIYKKILVCFKMKWRVIKYTESFENSIYNWNESNFSYNYFYVQG